MNKELPSLSICAQYNSNFGRRDFSRYELIVGRILLYYATNMAAYLLPILPLWREPFVRTYRSRGYASEWEPTSSEKDVLYFSVITSPFGAEHTVCSTLPLVHGSHSLFPGVASCIAYSLLMADEMRCAETTVLRIEQGPPGPKAIRLITAPCTDNSHNYYQLIANVDVTVAQSTACCKFNVVRLVLDLDYQCARIANMD